MSEVACSVAGCGTVVRAQAQDGMDATEFALHLVDDLGWALVGGQWRCPPHAPACAGH